MREGTPGGELRYALRSWHANTPHRRVHLAGYRPWWVSGEVGHIPFVQGGGGWWNTTAAMRAACLSREVSDPFVWMNDDFFTMAPAGPSWPASHRGPLSDFAGHLRDAGYLYGYVLQAEYALERLDAAGYHEPLCYESHTPLLVRKDLMLLTLDVFPGVDAMKRSAYGAVAQLGGQRRPDVKVSGRRVPFDPGAPLLSTLPDAFANGAVGEHIRASFPEPCPYERGCA